MKKYFIFLLLLAIATYAIADDALVLPKGVIRTYITGAYAFASQEWDANGDKQDLGTAKYNALNIGGAVEFGVTDWISAAVQWAPGWNVWSDLPDATAPADTATINGPADIFAGAKIQIIGEKAPVVNSMMRLAFAPGVKIPLPGPDYADEATKQAAGDPWIVSSTDKHVLGVGARAYFDYVFNKMLYVNLYSEFIYYAQTIKREEISFTDWYLVNNFPIPNSDVAFGYDLTIEAEPHYEMMIADGMRLSFGLPITFSISPEIKYDDVAQADTDSYVLAVSPNVSLFLMKFFLPLEFKVGYTLPFLGKNANATNALVLQVKAYMKF